MTPIATEILANPAWYSLLNAHASMAVGSGAGRCYPHQVSPFAGLADAAEKRSWSDLAAAAEPGEVVVVIGPTGAPEGWQYVGGARGVQLVDDGVHAHPDHEAVRLDASDVPQMLALVQQTKPGPFAPRTIELGTYLGIKRDDQLIAMAGQRLHPPGFIEISAVCTHPDYRKQGLAARLVRAITADIHDRGDTAIMHASADNAEAIRLYESLGFATSGPVIFSAYQVLR